MFDMNGLSVVAYAVGFTSWCYKTRDSIAEVVNTCDYFSAAAAILDAAGDQINVVAADGAAILLVAPANRPPGFVIVYSVQWGC